MSRTSRHGERPDWPEEASEAFEELSDDAIIAQQSRAHLPQKRASVHEEIRTVVIADERPRSVPPPSRAPKDRSALRANTVLVRDRRAVHAVQQMREQYRVRRARSRILIPFMWAGLALAAFAAGGLVTLLIARGTSAVFPTLQKGRAAAASAISPGTPTQKR